MADNNLSAPSGNIEAVTPHDTNDITLTRGLYVGVAGDVVVISQNGQQVTITGALAGVVYPFRVTRVLSTNTTATNIVAVY